ncbi:hypothetical protein BKA93DRAFT_805136 [Sparassis latifolia]
MTVAREPSTSKEQKSNHLPKTRASALKSRVARVYLTRPSLTHLYTKRRRHSRYQPSSTYLPINQNQYTQGAAVSCRQRTPNRWTQSPEQV